MIVLSYSIIIILLLGVFSGLLLKFSNKSIEKYQNKYLLRSVKITNIICSSIILIPFQIIASFLIILVILAAIILSIEKIVILNELTLFITISIWLISMQFYMKLFWKIGKYIPNSISDCLQLPEKVSSFIGYLFYGKTFNYFIALIFVVINNINLNILLFDKIIPNEFWKIINSSILVFIAADRIINSIQSWMKANSSSRTKCNKIN